LAGELKPEGQSTAVGPYMFPRLGADTTPVQKISFVTKASADLGCGVGYYKQGPERPYNGSTGRRLP
jgi:hypothetical protein